MQHFPDNELISSPGVVALCAARKLPDLRRFLPSAFLIIFAVLISADRVLMPPVPINVDPGSYAVVSHELLDGRSLYVDIWDHKPPGPFIVYAAAELMFGYSTQMLFILNYLIVLIVMVGIFQAARVGPGDAATGVFAAGLWAIVSGSYGLEARDANTEVLINACMIFAFYLMAAHRRDRFPITVSILVGLLFLMASLLKPVIIFIALFVGAAHIFFSTKRKAALSDVILIGGTGVAGWLATFGYFAATGRARVFYETIIIYNRHYAGNIWENLIAPFDGKAEFLIDIIGPLAIFGILGAVFCYRCDRHLGALIIAFIVSGWIAIAAPGRFSVHYFQLWLPPLIVGAAWGIGYFAAASRQRFRVASVAAGVVLALLLVGSQWPTYRAVIAHQFAPVQPVLSEAEKTAAFIGQALAENETFYLWGNSPSLYMLSGHRPPAAIIFDSHLEENPLFSVLAERLRTDLERTRPELLVTEFGRPPVPAWISKDYDTNPIFSTDQGFSVFVRRDGRLAGAGGAK